MSEFAAYLNRTACSKLGEMCWIASAEVMMKRPRTMPVTMSVATMWTLNPDKRSIRLALPPVPVAGQDQPMFVVLDFEADTIDETIDRLLACAPRCAPNPWHALGEFCGAQWRPRHDACRLR